MFLFETECNECSRVKGERNDDLLHLPGMHSSSEQGDPGNPDQFCKNVS